MPSLAKKSYESYYDFTKILANHKKFCSKDVEKWRAAKREKFKTPLSLLIVVPTSLSFGMVLGMSNLPNRSTPSVCPD